MDLRPSRRDILKVGAAATAGMAAGLPSSLLRALAAPAACGKLADIQHVVILIQENRSFDHYFGTFPGVRGFDDRSLTQPDGSSIFAQRFDPQLAPGVPQPLLPFHLDTQVAVPGPRPGECTNDVEHQWAGQHGSWHGGANDNWMPSHLATDGAKDAVITMGYYTRADIPLYHQLADNFTICDHYHCSVIAGTDINRLYSVTGTCDPDGWDGGLQSLDTQLNPTSFPMGVAGKWVPYPQLLQQAGISWKIYGTSDGQVGDNVLRYFPQFRPGGDPQLSANAFSSNAFPYDFAADCLSGRLPQVSWLLAALPDTEHAPAPLEWGQDVTHTVLEVMTNSGIWSSSVLFITYDENGGFFDHVPPPVPPTAEPGEYLNVGAMGPTAKANAKNSTGDYSRGPVGLGHRVPMLVISPFTRNPDPKSGPLVCSDLFDHTSMLRFLETRFGVPIPTRDPSAKKPGLSPWRRHLVGDMTSAFNFAAGANITVPGLVLTDRADPRVLAECTITNTTTTLFTNSISEGYPVPAQQAMPKQETLTGAVKRPSGICTTAAVQPTSGAPPPPTSANQLPATAAVGPGLLAAEVGLGAALAASAWWAARRMRPDRSAPE